MASKTGAKSKVKNKMCWLGWLVPLSHIHLQDASSLHVIFLQIEKCLQFQSCRISTIAIVPHPFIRESR